MRDLESRPVGLELRAKSKSLYTWFGLHRIKDADWRHCGSQKKCQPQESRLGVKSLGMRRSSKLQTTEYDCMTSGSIQAPRVGVDTSFEAHSGGCKQEKAGRDEKDGCLQLEELTLLL